MSIAQPAKRQEAMGLTLMRDFTSPDCQKHATTPLAWGETLYEKQQRSAATRRRTAAHALENANPGIAATSGGHSRICN